MIIQCIFKAQFLENKLLKRAKKSIQLNKTTHLPPYPPPPGLIHFTKAATAI